MLSTLSAHIGTAACASLTQLLSRRCQTAGNPEAPSPPAPLGAGERASTPASPACQPAFQTRRPTDPTAPPCPRNRQAPDHRRHSAALTMCSRCEGAVQNGRRTYINPAPSPFKRPPTGSLQHRRATRAVSGEAGYSDHHSPLSRAFLHHRDEPPGAPQSKPSDRNSRAISSGISPSSPVRSGGA